MDELNKVEISIATLSRLDMGSKEIAELFTKLGIKMSELEVDSFLDGVMGFELDIPIDNRW